MFTKKKTPRLFITIICPAGGIYGLLMAAQAMAMNLNGNRPNNKLYSWIKNKIYSQKRIILSCKNCGEDIHAHKFEEHTKKYCSMKCYSEGMGTTYHICEFCDKEFKLFRSANACKNSSRFCSKKCRKESNLEEVSCGHCNKKYKKPKYDRVNGKFCSKQCYDESGRITKDCAWCKKPFKVVKCKSKQKCCGLECSYKDRARNARKKNQSS